MNAPASSGTSDSGAAAGSDSEQDSGSSSEPSTDTGTKTYTVTLSSTDAEYGLVQIDDEEAAETVTKTVASGTQVTIKAVPTSKGAFDEWSDGDTHDTRTITVTSNINLTVDYGANL